jgi:hypothetical protein
MPALPPDSTDSPPPSATQSSDRAAESEAPRAASTSLAWRKNAWLFVATVVSVFVTFVTWTHWSTAESLHAVLVEAAQFTAALLGILLAHEFGHYIAARIHQVDASLPYFIPLPILSPFGTMGAVIRMRSVIPTRKALLDIGAAGPLAGLALAIPLYAWGAVHSKAVPVDTLGDGNGELGASLLLRLLNHFFAPIAPDGMELVLSPVAYAGWAGMFVTMINLLPVGQLDGGHVAFALFGEKQNRIAQWVHRSMLVFFFVSLASFVARDLRAGLGLWHFGRHANNSLFWLVWFEVLAMLGSLSTPAARRASPEGGDDRLGIRTRLFATACLGLLAGLFRDEASILDWGAWLVGLGVLLAMEARWGCLRGSSTMVSHPPTGSVPLTAARLIVAIVTLTFFGLLFMPTPIAL